MITTKTAQNILIQRTAIQYLHQILRDNPITEAYSTWYRGKDHRGKRFMYSYSYETWESGRLVIKHLIKNLQRGLAVLQAGRLVDSRNTRTIILTQRYKVITKIQSSQFRRESVEEVTAIMLLLVLRAIIDRNNLKDFIPYCNPILTKVQELMDNTEI